MEALRSVSWSLQARIDILAVCYYLDANWSQKTTIGFLERLRSTANTIGQYPKIGHNSSRAPHMLRILATKHNYVYYRLLDDAIHVVRVVPTSIKPEPIY